MESEGRWVDLEDIEKLLKWQYAYFSELDSMLAYTARILSSPLGSKPRFDRTFIGQTINRLSAFRADIGQGMIFKNKPITDFIDQIPDSNQWLDAYKETFDIDDPDSVSTGDGYLATLQIEIAHTLSSVHDLIIDRESAYVRELDPVQARAAIKKRRLELASSKVTAPQTSYLADYYRDKESDLYTLLASYLEPENTSSDSEQPPVSKEMLLTVINNITTSGSGNVINTGQSATVIATVHQQLVGQDVTAESVAEEIRQLTGQIRDLLKQPDGDKDAKEEVIHQLATVDRQVSKETPNFTIAGKALGVVETLLTDALSSQTAPVILASIQQVMAHVQTLSI